jgi:phosphoglucosamine mutase
MLEAALEAGFSAAGVDVCLVGPMPTPAIAYLTRALRLQAGIVISASHNPYYDNGIKFFSAQGTKLPDEMELEIEAALDEPLTCVDSAALGRARRIDDADGRYIEFCKGTFPFEHGLARTQDRRRLRQRRRLPHRATCVSRTRRRSQQHRRRTQRPQHQPGCRRNGARSALRQAVVAQGADLGIALDGDADRLLMVDARHPL